MPMTDDQRQEFDRLLYAYGVSIADRRRNGDTSEVGELVKFADGLIERPKAEALTEGQRRVIAEAVAACCLDWTDLSPEFVLQETAAYAEYLLPRWENRRLTKLADLTEWHVSACCAAEAAVLAILNDTGKIE